MILKSFVQFDHRKLGDDEIANNFRQKLQQDIDQLESKLKNSSDQTFLALLAILGIAAYAG